jgi:hypothetical protein
MKEVLTKVGKFVENVLFPFIWGSFIAITFICLGMLFSVIGSSSDCRDKGNWLGYASQYSVKQGCQFKIDKVWTSIDTLDFVLKK